MNWYRCCIWYQVYELVCVKRVFTGIYAPPQAGRLDRIPSQEVADHLTGHVAPRRPLTSRQHLHVIDDVLRQAHRQHRLFPGTVTQPRQQKLVQAKEFGRLKLPEVLKIGISEDQRHGHYLVPAVGHL